VPTASHLPSPWPWALLEHAGQDRRLEPGQSLHPSKVPGAITHHGCGFACLTPRWGTDLRCVVRFPIRTHPSPSPSLIRAMALPCPITIQAHVHHATHVNPLCSLSRGSTDHLCVRASLEADGDASRGHYGSCQHDADERLCTCNKCPCRTMTTNGSGICVLCSQGMHAFAPKPWSPGD